MPRLRSFFILINLKTVIVAGLSVASTFACRHYGIFAEFPLTLIAIAVVFPIVFSIGGAYKRREAALDDYASMKAHGRSIYFAFRDWPESTTDAMLTQARQLLGNVMSASRTLFVEPISSTEQNEKRVYESFSELSGYIQTLRSTDLASGEVSRCNQYFSKMMFAFESVKHIYQYRTPLSLRTYSDVFIVLLPVIYGPYFASVAEKSSSYLVFVLPVLFSLILVSLDNIQAHLENPFDQVGEDDIRFNVERFVQRLEDLPPPASRRRSD